MNRNRRDRYVEFERNGETVRARVVQSLDSGSTLEVGWLNRSGRTFVQAADTRLVSKAEALANPGSVPR